MVENIQCPVCTLFLHAGMDLSDHLETHPKEQVIKALVQMTITGGGSGSSGTSAALTDEEKPNVETISKARTNEKEHEISTNSTTNSSSPLPTTTSAHNSLNLSFCAPHKQENIGFVTTHKTSGKHIFNQQNVTSSPAYQKSGEPHGTNSGCVNDVGVVRDIKQMPTDFSTYSNRYQHQHQHQQQQTSSQQHLQHVADAHQRPPPPPPPPQLPHQITPLASSGGSHSFQALQQHQPPMLAHQHQNSAHHQHHTHQVQQHQQQNHHRQQHTSMAIAQQQNLKIIYSSTLPPPPPLQLFSYQPPTQPQHQKPPPAYGTAISQIRSQHNQNKQTLQQHQMQQRSAPLSAIASTSKHATLKQNLPSNLLAAAATQQKQYQSQHHETAQQQTQQHLVKNFAANTSLPKTTGAYQQRVQPPTTALPLTVVAAAGSRQSESPYPAILTAAIASPSSSSSVLRYAESPVTVHYLERDNGDFIVQEIPKHIVECVEKDNGEFSVIERIYQSPPSVLHIHDDDEDDDIENGNDNTSNEDVKLDVNDETNKSLKDDENNKEKHEDDEDFMSADSNSDMDDSSEKSFSKTSGKLSKDYSANTTPLEQTAVNSSICSEISVVNSNSNSNFSTTTNNSSGLTTRKKSSKNTITVLSDVQLNLNEYLDLVGNIIASSKIAQNRNTFSASTSASASATPLLKIEKVEPYDEYEQYEMSENMPVVESEINVDRQMEATSLIEPPKTTNNKDNITETDELIANKYSNKSSPNEINTNKVVTATPEENKLNEIKNVAAIYSSHATSVIRMATTNTASQQFMKEAELLPPSVVDIVVEKKIINDLQHSNDIQQEQRQDAEDLSQTKIKHEVKTEDILLKIPPPIPLPPLKKGPKKLVIKPKSNKTDANNIPAVAKIADENLISDEQPTTSAKAQKVIQLDKIEKNKTMEQTALQQDTETNVIVKSEYSITEQTSILEQHLKLGFQQLELKEEQPSARNDTTFSLDNQKIKNESDEFNDVPKIYTESNEEHSSCLNMPNVTEDARVLLNFANSKKSKTDATSTTVSFPSSNSIFAGSLLEKSISTNATCSSSSTQNTAGITTTVVAANFSTSNSASAAALSTLRCDDEFIVPDATDVQEIVISSSYSSQSASDIALNNYNNVTMTDQHQHNFSDYPFSFLYGGGSVAQQIETKGNFSPIYQHQPHDATTAATLASGSNSATIEDFTPAQSSSHQHQQRYHHHATAGAGQWYHAVSTSNADFEAALAVDCTDTDNDVGKYLDLDACKRDNITAAQAAPCSSSSSFAAATESSLAGCTTDALNIRTDEKMPAKGEISEQESNCDIENSWSQPMYGDIPARFFKTSFPGLFPQENWNGVEYFTVHDLSASAGTTSASNRATKSFDFRLPLEAITTSSATAGSLQQQQCAENLPSSSKKKRKRESNVAKNSTATSRKVAATVTSHDLLLQQQRQQIQQQQHQQQQQQQQQQLQLYHQQPTTSAAILAGPSTAAASSSAAATSPIAAAAAAVVVIHKQRKKIYQCAHCPLQFTKLKDRNLHMIALHNYIRQNRRLVSLHTTAVTITTATATVTSAENLAIIPFNGASGSSNILTIPPSNFVESIEDSKQGIIKIEMENAEQAIASLSTVETITAKSELVDEKDNLALMPTTSTPNAVVDLKPPTVRPLALTHATKLATLYRMLVSFNISTLKQNSNLSEVDEKLMESYIFFCYICRQHFNTVKFYDAHLTEHPAECFTCGKKFHRWKNFSLHLKRHLGWKEFGCSVCDKKFVVRSALVEHMRMHTGLTPLKCKICGKNFKRYSNLTQHRKRHGRQILRKKEFVCHCGEVLPSKARFLWHKETHDAKPKCCPYCCDRFVHANSLRRHIRLAHSDKFDYTEPMECPMCKQVFAKSSIRAHMATHSMDTQHDCPICNKSFSTKWNLKIHSWVHANRTAKPFKCEHCPKAFVREVDFKNHMNAHKQIKPYTCEYCGCKFIRKYNYMRHRREHHGNKKFTCDLCKKSFHRHYYLIEHRRIHTGERPFQCTICGKSSTTKTNHNKHLKIHHSRDPFTVEA